MEEAAAKEGEKKLAGAAGKKEEIDEGTLLAL